MGAGHACHEVFKGVLARQLLHILPHGGLGKPFALGLQGEVSYNLCPMESLLDFDLTWICLILTTQKPLTECELEIPGGREALLCLPALRLMLWRKL